ncbi:MAG: SPFH domain-containing protein [Candidatus Diapherotrites archaeon]|nr:SPFH domain-containing protein [Candidatus Diapherotrites archaeon]MDZ4256482.1 SPFH domain-containing protein [archaeon]
MGKRLGKVESYKVKQGIFAGALIVGVVALYFVAVNATFLAQAVLILGFLILFLLVVNQYDFLLTLKEYERAVIYRLGRVRRVGGPGWTLVIPLFETFKIVDLRTQTLDVPPQSIITKDNIVVKVDAVIYLFVKKDDQSVINSVIEVDDYAKGAQQFVQAKLRDVSGGMLLSELISDIATLNTEIQKDLQQIARSWGVSVESVEIQSIEVPKEVEEAFSSRAAAEQAKLAQIQRALGMQAEIDSIREAAKLLDDKSLSYFYIKALEVLGQGASTKFILPLELTSLIQTLANKSTQTHSKKQLEEVFEQYAPKFFTLLQEAKVPPKRSLRKSKRKRKR